MKRLLALGAALALVSSVAMAQGHGQGPGMMGGPGRMGGPGMMGGQGMMGGGMMAALDLTDEQRQKVDAIREEFRKKNWAAMGEVRAEQYRLRSLYAAEPLDANKIAEQQKKVDELRRTLLKSRVEAHNQIAAVLTPEQRKQLRHAAPAWLGDTEH